MATLKDVLEHERKQIEMSRDRRLPPNRKKDAGFIGLALSGGGIRSATFNLGLLQSFATHKLLSRFDYLSTVSGGGYIGSWLMAWMHKEKTSISDAERVFGVTAYDRFGDNEQPSVRFLRNYSRYLSPQAGLLSADPWTLVATYLRNTTLNLVIFIAILVLLLLAPRLIVAVGFWTASDRFIHDIHGVGAIPVIPLILGSLLSLNAMWWIGKNQANVPLRKYKETTKFPWYTKPIWVQVTCVNSLVGGCASYSIALHSALQFNKMHFSTGYTNPAHLNLYLFTIRLVFVKVFLIGATLYAIFSAALGIGMLLIMPRLEPVDRQLLVRRLVTGLFYWTLPASAVSGLLLMGVAFIFNFLRNLAEGQCLILAAGTFLLMTALQITATVHIGLIGRRVPDEIREWSARFGAWTMIYNIFWLVAFGFVVYAPILIESAIRVFPKEFWFTTSIWVAVTVGGVIAAKKLMKRASRGNPKQPALDLLRGMLLSLLARTAPYLFIIGILGFLTLGIAHLPTMSQSGTLLPAETGSSRALLALTMACLLAAGFFGWRVDVNEFSMHSLYRNRLVRCYLGASAKDRKPQPFTAFDPSDDFGLSEFAIGPTGDMRAWPYFIINATLNVVKGKDALSLQSRKAKSFIFTPLYCGYDKFKYAPTQLAKLLGKANWHAVGTSVSEKEVLGDTTTMTIPGPAPESYGRTDQGGSGGISLGTAMAISGAAASPNMGYRSTIATGFLLSLLNIRLGWWIGNPGDTDAWGRGAPTFGLYWLLCELFGITTDESKFLHLSDGGHFENLGIYELVRRECEVIVVSDATCDPAYHFADLANAIERCRTDFAININIPDLSDMRPALNDMGQTKPNSKSFAIGTIDYGNNKKGVLVYLKPTLMNDLPTDVGEYARLHQDEGDKFPHQSTRDQFFGELQFESYRMLGTRIGDEAAKTILAEIDKVFDVRLRKERIVQ